ncbi:hypothetical protein F4860DRAFT_520207 [Xylaria cubensis]|nr:hypothetical protein F4860DRAFT_520207 [Xylaria cubensis]
MGLDFDFNAPLSPTHGSKGADNEFNAPMPPYGSGSIIDPFIIDVSDSGKDDVQDLPPPAYGDGVGSETRSDFGVNLQSTLHSDIGRLYELFGLTKSTMAGNSDVPPLVGDDANSPMSLDDTAGFEQDIYFTESSETTYASRDIALDEQVKFDRVALLVADDDNDVVMADVPMAGIANFDDILSVFTIPGSETIQAPVLPNSTTDAPLPSWMMAVLQPGFLQELRVCNLKEITLEKDKIHFSFA